MKQKNMKRTMLVLLLLMSFMLTSLTAAADDPTIAVDPAKPKPQGTVTFTATIPNVENIQQVKIRVQECGNEPGIGYICYTDEINQTLTETGTNTYSGSVTLTHENAIEIKYQLNYQTSEGWIDYPEDLAKLDLDLSDGNSNDNNDADTPGFETIAFIAAVSFILFIFFKRRR